MSKVFDDDRSQDAEKLLQPLIAEEKDYEPFKPSLQEPSEGGGYRIQHTTKMLTTNLDEIEDNHKSAATAEDRVDQLMYLVKQKVESYKAEKERSQE